MRLFGLSIIRTFLIVAVFVSQTVGASDVTSELVVAADKGNLSLVNKIIESHSGNQEELQAAFWAATKKGHVPIVERLLPMNVEVNWVSDDQYTPLMRAARDGREQLVEILLAAGADVNAMTEEGTALMNAAEKDRRKVIAILIAANADINAKRADDRTALTLAAQEGHTLTIQALINAGANVNYQAESSGATPLMVAVQHGHYNATYALIAAKADLNLKAKNGMTALGFANHYRYKDIVDLLKKSGAK